MQSEQSSPPSAPVAAPDTFRADLLALIPFLRAFSRTLCGHRDQADDLCQEALAKAWHSPFQHSGIRSLEFT